MENKMSQKDLATKLNAKPQVIQQWEAGKVPIPGNYIAMINKTLGINLRQLIKK
jgi:ribosome-binding protein aMBF1 (putative translation factor)